MGQVRHRSCDLMSRLTRSSRTARVWKNFQEVYELSGHAQAVWAVLALSPEQFLTGTHSRLLFMGFSILTPKTQGAADNTIKMWHSHKNVKTFTGHAQPVRGLIQIPDIGFASCSNDRSVAPIYRMVQTMNRSTARSVSGRSKATWSIA